MKRLLLSLATCLALFAVPTACTKKEDAKPAAPIDRCAGVTCLNGGTCANGTCNCPPGWMGSDCSQERTPTKVTITKFELTRYPALAPSGNAWDYPLPAPASLPDIYLEIGRQDGVGGYSTSTVFDNASLASLPIVVTATGGYAIDSPSLLYSINVYDQDAGTGDEFLGGYNFTAYTSGERFPSIITMDLPGGTVGLKLYVTYTW